VVPGLVIAVMVFVALPACAVERTGPIRSLSRSVDLTEGFRWRVFLVFAVHLLFSLVLSLVLQSLARWLLGPQAALIVVFLWQVLAIGLGGILAGVTYHELRVAREGTELDRFAAIFD